MNYFPVFIFQARLGNLELSLTVLPYIKLVTELCYFTMSLLMWFSLQLPMALYFVNWSGLLVHLLILKLSLSQVTP